MYPLKKGCRTARCCARICPGRASTKTRTWASPSPAVRWKPRCAPSWPTAGEEPSVIVANVKVSEGSYGYNAATGEFGDMIAMGILDPTKVTRSALQHAASVSRPCDHDRSGRGRSAEEGRASHAGCWRYGRHGRHGFLIRLARSSGNRTAPARSDPGNDPTSRPQGRGRSPAAMPGFLLCPRRGNGHCCKVSDEAAFCLIQRPYISKTLLTRRISPRGSP